MMYPVMDMRRIFAEETISKAKEMRKKRVAPWDVDKFMFRAIGKAHRELLACDPRTEAGLFNAQRWADAIEMMVEYVDSVDRQAQTMDQALTYSCHPRLKDNGKVQMVPDVIRNGKVLTWKKLLVVDARMAMETIYDGKERESFVPIAVTQLTPSGERKVVTAFTSVRRIGEAELGQEDDYRPVPEPWFGSQQREILRQPGSNTVQLPDDGEAAFNVVREEPIQKRMTYNPDAEQDWLDFLMDVLENDVASLNQLVFLYDEVEKLYAGKVFRFHVYKQIHNAIVEKARSVEKIKDHPKVSDWKMVGADHSVPNHGDDLRKKIEILGEKLATAKLAGNKQLIKKISWERGKVYRAWFQMQKEHQRSMHWAWNNFLAAEGMGEGRDGQPFGDHSFDALQQKNARATGGSMEEIDALIYGEYDESDEAAPGQGGPSHSVSIDEVSLVDEILQLEGVGPQTVAQLENAGYRTLEQINNLSLSQLQDILNHRGRALTIWWGGAEMLFQDDRTEQEMRDLAVSRFGSSRGASVDLVRPWDRDRHALACLNPQESQEATGRVSVQDYSVSDGEIAAWEQGMKAFSCDEWEEVPPVAGFNTIEQALSAIVKL